MPIGRKRLLPDLNRFWHQSLPLDHITIDMYHAGGANYVAYSIKSIKEKVPTPQTVAAQRFPKKHFCNIEPKLDGFRQNPSSLFFSGIIFHSPYISYWKTEAFSTGQ